MKALRLDPAKIKYILMSHRVWDSILKPQAGPWILDARHEYERSLQEREPSVADPF